MLQEYEDVYADDDVAEQQESAVDDIIAAYFPFEMTSVVNVAAYLGCLPVVNANCISYGVH